MKYFPFFFILIGFSLFAQESKPIAEKINQYHQKNQRFETFNLLGRNSSSEKQNLYKNWAEDALVLELNLSELQRLMNERPETIEISFPYKETEITVELFKNNILTENFEPVDQNAKAISYQPGVYYRGIVKNDPGSIAAFSFFDHGMMGVASSLGTGNVVIGKAKNSSDYLSYTDYTLSMENPFKCGVDELVENQKQQISYQEEMASRDQFTVPNCVRIYYEIAYEPYLNNGSDTTATLNWITGVHNNIATLYANDNIQIALSEVLIWTEQDPFVYDYQGNLYYFTSFRPAFNGDLAHLVNSPSTTSVAFLNSLCGTSRYAYSGISQYYAEVPTYSWTIMAMTHEMGHALGSPHTHACAWNGDNTAIDGCGPTAGYDEGCDAALPTSGGTIMSYCHLVPSVGINLANGFGPQPGALIRSTIASKSCLGTDCVVSCAFTVSDLIFTNVTSTSAQITIEDAIGDSWEYKFYPVAQWSSSWIQTSTETVQVSGLQPNTYYWVIAKNVCTSGSINAQIQRLLLTNGDYCGGDLFVDTGGQNANYIDGDQMLVKTFYPDANTKLTLTFSEFNLEDGYDFMTIYDGENTDAPIFANAENLTGNTIPGPFESTDPSGAITVKFTADSYSTRPGWVATFACTPLGIEDFQHMNEIVVYPNPSRSQITIESKIPVHTIQIYDLLGRLVKQQGEVNALKTNMNLNGMEKGVYFIRIEANGKMQTIKLIKE
ncbi:MAG TPA: T9SS type A sorting domain-containing protein [Flavobacteriaceae bacterium]|nr:T9SS type A sorting domain-containing protein [Flavobacteriaceae bacterium]